MTLQPTFLSMHKIAKTSITIIVYYRSNIEVWVQLLLKALSSISPFSSDLMKMKSLDSSDLADGFDCDEPIKQKDDSRVKN